MVYDILEPLQIGDIVTYGQLAEAMEVDDARDYRSSYGKAFNVWGEQHQRAFIPVTRVGYRVADAPEHEHLARGQHRKAKRALGRSRTVLERADRNRLDEVQKAKFDKMETHLARQQDMIRRIDAKVDRYAAKSDARHEATDQRVSKLEQLLRDNGITFDD